MKIDKNIIDSVTLILLSAVSEKTKVRVDMKIESVCMSFYQDKIGIDQYLTLYMQHTDGRNDYLMFSVKNIKDNSDNGYFSIFWDKVNQLKVETFDSNRYMITIDNKLIIQIF